MYCLADERQRMQLKLNESDDLSMLFGAHDKHIKLIEEHTSTIIRTRGEVLEIEGTEENAALVTGVIEALQELIRRGINISAPDIVSALKMAKSDRLAFFVDMYEEEIVKDRNGKPIRVKNAGQKQYVASEKS